MVETSCEYGVGVRNRFAFLDNDGDNDDENMEGAGSISIMTKKASAGKKVDSRNVGKAGVKTASAVVGQRLARIVPAESVPKGRNQPTIKDEKKGVKDNNAGGGFAPEKQSHQASRGSRREGPPPNRRHYNKGRSEEDKVDQKDAEMKNSASGNEASEIDGEEKVASAKKDGQEKTEDTPDDENVSSTVEKTLTLAEWKALQAPREKPVFNIRKPGEGEVTSKLEKLVLKKREDFNEHEEYETYDVYYPQRAGKMKLVSDVGFTTGYQRRRGGRFPAGGTGGTSRAGGGDGCPREGTPGSEQTNAVPEKPRGRPRFGPRGGLQRPAQVPRIDDASDFPTLG